MKLSTWTFYNARDLISPTGEKLIEGNFRALLIRPDFSQPNKSICLGLEQSISNSMMLDIMNKNYTEEKIYEIFKKNIGLVDTDTLEEIIIEDINLSVPINEKNIKLISLVYGVFFNKESIKYNSDDFKTKENVMSKSELFVEKNLNNIPLPHVLKSISSGLNEYNNTISEIEKLTDKNQIIERKLSLINIQSNLISFYDRALSETLSMIEKYNEKERNKQ